MTNQYCFTFFSQSFRIPKKKRVLRGILVNILSVFINYGYCEVWKPV